MNGVERSTFMSAIIIAITIGFITGVGILIAFQNLVLASGAASFISFVTGYALTEALRENS
jgi:hypothetical protein